MIFPFNRRLCTSLLFLTTLLFLLSTACLLQAQIPAMTKDYLSEWKNIDSLAEAGLFSEARTQSLQLYRQAQADEQPLQALKALLHWGGFNNEVEEKGLLSNIAFANEELATADYPLRPLLQSILAEAYHNYLDANRWEISQRTPLADGRPEAMDEWTSLDFVRASTALYLASLQDGRSRELPVEQLSPLLQPGYNLLLQRPTLYDLLLQRALGHFQNTNAYLSEPEHAFRLDQAQAFAPAEVFVSYPFPAHDSSSFVYQSLLIYQQGLRWRLQRAADQAAALTDLDLSRLQFVSGHFQGGDVPQRLRAALDQLLASRPDAWSQGAVKLAIARWYYEQGQGYERKREETHALRFAWAEAEKICRQLEADAQQPLLAAQAAALAEDIRSRSLDGQVERVYLPGAQGLYQVSYRNIDKVYGRIVAQEGRERNLRDDELLNYYAGLKPLQSWQAAVTNPGDFRLHTTEQSFGPLRPGRYLLLLSTNPQFDTNGQRLAFSFAVTQMALLQHPEEERREFVVVDRSTGAPLAGVKAVPLSRSDEYRNEARWNEGAPVYSDADGRIQLPRQSGQGYLRLRLSKGKDVFETPDPWYIYDFNRRQERQTNVHFFLDRAIYRPGQKVYFKGLVVQYDQHRIPSVMIARPVTITLRDANWQEVSTQEFRSNIYGSISGSFVLPEGVLTGNMSLQADVGNSNIYFAVEAYKRPRFEVSLQPPGGQPQLGDTVTVAASAMSYAGPAVAGASVRYTVTRHKSYSWRPMRGWWPDYNSSGDAIASGTVTTDAKGNCSIRFAALPPAAYRAGEKAIYRYELQLDVTDGTGETQSASSSLLIGSHRHIASLEVPGRHDNTDSLPVRVQAVDLNQQPVQLQGELQVYRLQAPQQFFINRYWEKPEYPMADQRHFRRHFPLLAYGQEDEPEQWQPAALQHRQLLSSREAAPLQLAVADWPAGHYLLSFVYVDENGDSLRLRSTLQLSDRGRLPAGIAGQVSGLPASLQPGDSLQLQLASSDGNTRFWCQLANRTEQQQGWYDSQARAQLRYPLSEADRGNLQFNLTYVRFNRIRQEAYTVAVPWTNKSLKIITETFRDKLSPGVPESWLIRIENDSAAGRRAELLASMYDASLDQLRPHNWSFDPYPLGNRLPPWQGHYFAATGPRLHSRYYARNEAGVIPPALNYPSLDLFGFADAYGIMRFMRVVPTMAGARDSGAPRPKGMREQEVMPMEDRLDAPPPPPPSPPPAGLMLSDSGQVAKTPPAGPAQPTPPPVRTNLQETAFFMPKLVTDEQGRTALRFTSPEALTRWKLQLLAHTTDLSYGYRALEVVTQKELMIQPNAPRFLREGDRLAFTAKVSNLSSEAVSCVARLELYDAATRQPLQQAYGLQPEQRLTVAADSTYSLSWPLEVPYGATGALIYRVTVESERFSDGEENALPVLSSRTLVTETLPLQVRGGQQRRFELLPLSRSAGRSGISHQQFTLEITTNPAWLAVKALPYLLEDGNESTTQLMDRYYANSLSTHIVGKFPRLKSVFDSWKNSPEALKSPLLTNEELKSAVLAETPWVMDAASESEQRARIATLFDLSRLSKEQAQAMDLLARRQQPGGGFAWYPGGRESWYISQYVVEKIAHLSQLGVADWERSPQARQVVEQALDFIDRQFVAHYEELQRLNSRQAGALDNNQLSPIVLHYLYTRSFFPSQRAGYADHAAWQYFIGQAEKYWLQLSLYEQGMAALALYRSGREAAARRILASLRDRALRSDELGLYWKRPAGWQWHELPVETHALMIELFGTLEAPAAELDELRLWLLKNKETNRWETTKATASAVYALLLGGSSWLEESQPLEISFPRAPAALYEAPLAAARQSAEAGSGYFKLQWAASDSLPLLASVSLRNPNEVVAFGGLYWQSFQPIDQVERSTAGPFSLSRSLFKEVDSPAGKRLEAVAEGSLLQPGDRLVVRMVVRSDREMSYVHLKDLRGSGLEPVEKLSGYRWEGGLSYYLSTTDLAANFFIDYLPKGTFVLEYPLQVVHRGNYSSGLASLQSFYAPAFSSHSEGVRVEVK